MDSQARTPTATSEAADKKRTLDQIPGGRYHIVERLSTGAIGAVYKALDTILDRPVAVKCVRLDTPFADHSPDELRERFVREARIAARLQHANIVTTHDIVATETRGFIIMEFIEGQSLEGLLKSQGRLPLSKAIRLLAQLADALDYAHQRNVVHRDVKPSNILVSPSMSVWVTDFGIAKSELSTNLTMAGGVLGTPDYMSPEQAKGEDVDARSDLFSLGCILFECVTGDKPFRSPSLTGVLLSIINDEPVFPLNWKSLGLPTGLKPILHHALEKSRDKRYPTGAALVGALEELPLAEVAAADEVRKAEAEAGEEVQTASAADEAERPQPGSEAQSESDTESEPESDTETDSLGSGESDAQMTDEGESQSEPQTAPAGDNAQESVEAPEPVPPVATGAGAEESEQEGGPERSEPDEDEPGTTARVETAAASEASPESDRKIEAQAAPERPPLDPERLESLKADGRPLRLSPTLSGDLHGVEISPEEGFILSRVDGVSRASEILALSPLQETESVRALFLLLDKELIHFGGTTIESPRAKARDRERATESKARAEAPAGPDEALVQEIDRLLELAERGAWAELLDVEAGAPARSRKSGYLRIIGKYHPDKHSWARNNGFHDKLSRLCAAASQAVEELAHQKPPAEAPPARPTSNGNGSSAPARSAGESTASFDRRKYARELHDRALRAYDLQDFWDTIQLSRQAVEADGGQADFYFLLGRALLQNKRWRKEAADAFRTASELEPMNIQYLGMLGAIYRAEGLSARAESILKRAREIDPEYELPDLAAEPEAKIETS